MWRSNEKKRMFARLYLLWCKTYWYSIGIKTTSSSLVLYLYRSDQVIARMTHTCKRYKILFILVQLGTSSTRHNSLIVIEAYGDWWNPYYYGLFLTFVDIIFDRILCYKLLFIFWICSSIVVVQLFVSVSFEMEPVGKQLYKIRLLSRVLLDASGLIQRMVLDYPMILHCIVTEALIVLCLEVPKDRQKDTVAQTQKPPLYSSRCECDHVNLSV